jgi:transcriptional regulator with XRE-family HTH domain
MNELSSIPIPPGELGERIRAARKARNWPLAHVASELGINKVSVWNWEQGRSRPRLNHLQRLAALLEVPLGTLCDPAASPKPEADQSPTEIISDCRRHIAKACSVDVADVEILVHYRVA